MKNNIRYKGNTNNTSVVIFVFFFFLVESQKLPAMVLCLGEPPGRFFLLLLIFILHFVVVLHFIFDLYFAVVVLHFISRLLFYVTGSPPWLLRPVKASTSSELLPRLLLIVFTFSSTASAMALRGRFLPTGLFNLTLLHRHFRLNLPLSRPPWEPAVLPSSLQGFILILETQTRLICLFDSQ